MIKEELKQVRQFRFVYHIPYLFVHIRKVPFGTLNYFDTNSRIFELISSVELIVHASRSSKFGPILFKLPGSRSENF